MHLKFGVKEKLLLCALVLVIQDCYVGQQVNISDPVQCCWNHTLVKMGLKSYHFCLQCMLRDTARYGIKTVPGNLLDTHAMSLT